MYTKGRNIKKDESNPKPFTIKCNCCGGTDVGVLAFDYRELGIACNECGAYLTCGSYREKKYREEN